MGYGHSSDHFQIVELLVRETDALVRRMGLHAVKHLKV
jgi:hypothetical protein